MDLIKKREQLKQERENYIMDLGEKEMGRTSNNELLKFNNGLKVYNNLQFPGEKLHKYNLTDNKIKMEISHNFGQVKHIDSLDNDPVVKTLQFFASNTEELMRNNYESYQFTPTRGGEALSHASHIGRELAASNKKRFIESLLNSLQSRKSIPGPGDRKLLLTEKLYLLIEHLALLDDQVKLHYLENLIDFLPDFDRDVRPTSDEIEWIFTSLD